MNPQKPLSVSERKAAYPKQESPGMGPVHIFQTSYFLRKILVIPPEQVSWLMDLPEMRLLAFWAMASCISVPIYSDRIARDSHPVPYSLCGQAAEHSGSRYSAFMLSLHLLFYSGGRCLSTSRDRSAAGAVRPHSFSEAAGSIRRKQRSPSGGRGCDKCCRYRAGSLV